MLILRYWTWLPFSLATWHWCLSYGFSAGFLGSELSESPTALSPPLGSSYRHRECLAMIPFCRVSLFRIKVWFPTNRVWCLFIAVSCGLCVGLHHQSLLRHRIYCNLLWRVMKLAAHLKCLEYLNHRVWMFLLLRGCQRCWCEDNYEWRIGLFRYQLGSWCHCSWIDCYQSVEAADARCASSPDLRISELASLPSYRAAIAAESVSTVMYAAGDGQSCCWLEALVWFAGQGAHQGSHYLTLSACLRSVSWRRGSKGSRKSVILRWCPLERQTWRCRASLVAAHHLPRRQHDCSLRSAACAVLRSWAPDKLGHLDQRAQSVRCSAEIADEASHLEFLHSTWALLYCFGRYWNLRSYEPIHCVLLN